MDDAGEDMSQDETVEQGPLTLVDILEAADAQTNLAEILPENDVTAIGQKVLRDVQIDRDSLTDWLPRYQRAMDTAMQVRQAKTFPWPGAANIRYPLLTTAAVQFQARAYPAIVDGSNLVKGRVLGPDPEGMKRARADRIGQHMTWQLLYRMPGWEEDTDRLLLMLPIVGCVFRKSYYDPISATNCSDMIPASDFIVNYWTVSLERAPRYTHVLHLYPHEAQERIASGLWRKIRVEGDNAGEDSDALVDFYEQHRMIDMDDDGYPEPYVVTTNVHGEVARIVPCFGLSDVVVSIPGGTAKLIKLVQEGRLNEVGQVVRIERRQYFSKYGFIPAPDGSFYDLGFGTLLEDISAAIDTALNQIIDAATLQNAQGGFVGSGVNIKGGNLKFVLGEWKRVDTTGGTLRDNIMPLTLPGPSSVLYSMLGMLIEAARDITSVQNVLTGEGTANQPATTTLALIEQGQKVMTAIFKRIHRAFGQELRILRRLNRDYLDEQEYFQLNDAEDAQTVEQADYADEDLDVVPVSDPTAVSDMQRMARAQASMVFNGDPLINQEELRKRYFEAIGERDIKALMTPAQTQAAPDPKILEVGARLALAKEETGAKIVQMHAGAADTLADAATKLATLGLTDDAAELAAAATTLGGMTDDGRDASEPADGPRDIEGMEGPAPDAGFSALPEGPPPGLDAGMGEGGMPDAGGAGAGGMSDGAGGPVG
jgi:chaperonin GroES